MSNSTHLVNVVKIEEILPCPNADNLGIVYIGGYQCVVQKAAYKVGDLALYVQPDTLVPAIKQFAFLWDAPAAPEYDLSAVPERKRRITVRKFRGNWSEGLLMPLDEFASNFISKRLREFPREGDDVAELLGFTHYEEPEAGPSRTPRTRPQYQHPWRSWSAFKFWVLYKLGFADQLHGDNAKPPKNTPPTYDVEGFKNYPNTFTEGEEVIVTEKIHGSNARYLFDGKQMHVGSKNLWKSEKSTCIWRRALKELPWIEEFCRLNVGHTLYAEVVPTQKGYAYGTETNGPEDKLRPAIKVLAFDVLLPNGQWLPKRELLIALKEEHRVPVLYAGPYDDSKIKALVEGPSTVPGAKHIREGIVIASATERTVRGLGRAQLKLKSLKFLEKEGK
jgi:hypothetical protein